MKTKAKKIFAVLMLCAILCSSVFSTVGAANLTDTFRQSASGVGGILKSIGLDLTEDVLTGALNLMQKAIPDRLSAQADSFDAGRDFYSGTETLLASPAAGARWSLGYARASLVPEDWQTKTYYLGGFIGSKNHFTNKVEEIIDDMSVRVIAISDGSGRGTTLFGTIDAIGVSNKDIRDIRLLVSAEAGKRGIQLNGVNISSTHCHSAIDTQGLWTNTFSKAFKNIIAAVTGFFKMEKGTDEDYIAFMKQRVAVAMADALANMTEGKLTYAVKDIGKEYFNNKNRKSVSSLPSELHRLLFVPDDPSRRATVIVNMGAHPDIVGLPTESNSGRALSGDYVYYIGDELEKNGYNFMFFNGAIAGIYIGRGPSGDNLPLLYRYQISERYGREIARMLMGMTLTEAEIKQAPFYDAETVEKEHALSGGGYTLWCENWTPVAERELLPVLNLRLKQVKITVTNPLILLAGKLRLANYNILKGSDGSYSVVTEIGYLQLGDLSAALVPGELVSDLYTGGASLTAEGSAEKKDFGHPSLKQLFGENTLCFGLTNDAIGYIVPDNDYKLVIFDDHYQELISLGAGTASTLMEAFESLAKEIS